MFRDKLTILVVDDEPDYCQVIKSLLLMKGHRADGVNDGRSALEAMERKDYDLVVADLLMPGMDGLALLREIKSRFPDTEVIIMTAYSSVEKAVQCMRDGAYTYVTKGEDPEKLLSEVVKIQKSKQLLEENAMLKTKVGNQDAMLETRSRAFAQVLTIARKAAENDVNVLLTGESGTGKEILASYIHRMSKRRDNFFVDINCHALSTSTLESELFGHEKGAFTGATSRRIGLFETADQGTLFLDEIGDVPMNTQTKLLKAIENKRIYRMGSSAPIDVNFRLITATNRNLMDEMEKGDFREDLYYRISTINIMLPALRERREDLPLLVEYFFRKSQEDTKTLIRSIPREVESFLLNYDYPGNIRELKNIIERLVVLSENGVVQDYALPLGDMGRGRAPQAAGVARQAAAPAKEPEAVWPQPQTGNGAPVKETKAQPQKPAQQPVYAGQKPSLSKSLGAVGEELSLREFRKNMEKHYIETLIERYDNMDKVAKVLSISRRQLFNKLVEFGLHD